MKVLVTGAFGTVGKYVLKKLVASRHRVTAFEKKTKHNVISARRFRGRIRIQWGDVTNAADVRKAVRDMECVVHLAAVIPPLADRKPDLAYRVNVEGTRNIVDSLLSHNPRASLIFTSSVAVYGDRLRDPVIRPDDGPCPNRSDGYANQKLLAEACITNSSLKWCILRLTYIVSENNLKFDPLMFEMPPSTSLEICHASDAARAIAGAVGDERVSGKILQIAGGNSCRTTFGEYLETILHLFGMGKRPLPVFAFSTAGYHCAYMSTGESQKLLSYQLTTLADLYESVRKKTRLVRFFMTPFQGIARKVLLRKSKYYSSRLHGRKTSPSRRILRARLPHRFREIHRSL